jgi:hypothetical protein
MANKPNPKPTAKPAAKPANIDTPLTDFLSEKGPVTSRTSVLNSSSNTPQELPFTARQYKLFGLGLFILVFGYFLLGIEDFQDVTAGFSVALFIAPVVIIGGYVWIVYAIMAGKKRN